MKSGLLNLNLIKLKLRAIYMKHMIINLQPWDLFKLWTNKYVTSTIILEIGTIKIEAKITWKHGQWTWNGESLTYDHQNLTNIELINMELLTLILKLSLLNLKLIFYHYMAFNIKIFNILFIIFKYYII